MPQNRRWDIALVYGSDPYAMTLSLLREIDAASLIPAGATIAIKPNLVVARPADEGATTHPQIAGAVIDYLRESGFDRLFLAEGSWVGADTDEAFTLCGYRTLAEIKQVPLYDLKQDAFVTRTVAGIPIELSRRVLEADFICNLPVLKGHCQTAVTCALKNMKGCISDQSKRQFHAMGLHKPIAALNTLLPPQLAVVDGICGDLDFEEGGNPVFAGRIFAGTDPVLVDSYGAELLGYPVTDIPYITMAEQLGVGSAQLETAAILRLNACAQSLEPPPSRRVRGLARHLRADCACSACYASAIHALGRMEEQGELERLGEKLCIGQGYRGKRLDNAGIGDCCRDLACSVPGCPPTAGAILGFLRGDLGK